MTPIATPISYVPLQEFLNNQSSSPRFRFLATLWKTTATLSALLLIHGAPFIEAAQKTTRPSEAKSEILLIEPTSASLAGGKASLITGNFMRRAGTFVGSYQLKVIPYTFKNEIGSISISVSDSQISKLRQGGGAELAGLAVTKGSVKTRPIKVSATSTGSAAGNLRISVITDNGELVFNTSYQIIETDARSAQR